MGMVGLNRISGRHKYFRISPPYKIHELLAQYVETHFDEVSETVPEMH
jgi:hypothetical protein